MHALTRRLALASVLAAGFFAAIPALGASPVNKSFLGTAVEGYDVVAYFTEGRPVEGTKEHTFEWKGATWRFSSAEHRDLFAANPEKYAPQYGGYCAYAVSQGSTAGIDPEAWTIHEGRLYLNLSPEIQARWSQDVPAYIAQANANWPRLSGEPAPVAAPNPCNPCAAKSAANPCNPCAKRTKAANPCANRTENPCNPRGY